MLMIGYLVLAAISYLAIPFAFDVSIWLVLIFCRTFTFSVIGFCFSIPQKGGNNGN